MSASIRVVIADDHHVVREGLRMILSEADGIEVVGEASDGAQAVRLVTSLQPDVLLIDLSMPQMDGIAAAKALKEAGSATRILVLTSFSDGEGVRDAVMAGVTGYLMKDVSSAEVVAGIRNAAAGIPSLHPRAQAQLMRAVSTPPQASPLDALTPRERDVLRLLTSGFGNKQIAAKLGISAGTVKGYVSEIFRKLGVGDRTQAALIAAKNGLGGG